MDSESFTCDKLSSKNRRPCPSGTNCGVDEEALDLRWASSSNLQTFFQTDAGYLVIVQASKHFLESYRHLVSSAGSMDTGADADMLRIIPIACLALLSLLASHYHCSGSAE